MSSIVKLSVGTVSMSGSTAAMTLPFDAPHDRDAAAAHLRVDEGVADRDPDLLAQLGAALAVADEEHVGHGGAAYR